MHEVGLVRAIAAAAERRAAGRPVRTVRIRVGVLHRAMPEPMRFAFETIASGTALDGARLDVVTVPITSTCRSCGCAEDGTDPVPVCPRCGAPTMDFAGGDELQLDALEYGRREPAAAAVG